MSEHRVRTIWSNGATPFTYETYPRAHSIVFKDGGDTMTASAAPVYRGDGKHADPEDMLVAALSSCHMLSFLAICARKKLQVESYQDDAVGFLEHDASKNGGKLWISRVILRPQVVFAPQTQPNTEEISHIHHMAHEDCFIANSVKTDVKVNPR